MGKKTWIIEEAKEKAAPKKPAKVKKGKKKAKAAKKK